MLLQVLLSLTRPKDHDVNLSTFSAVPSPGAHDACRLKHLEMVGDKQQSALGCFHHVEKWGGH